VFSYSRSQHFVYAQALAQSRFWNAEGGSIEKFMAYDMAHSVWTIDGAFGTTLDDNDISLSRPLTLSPYNNLMHSALTKFYRAATEMRGGYLDLFKGLCSNRSRCRRILCHVINGFDHLENTEVSTHRRSTALTVTGPRTGPSIRRIAPRHRSARRTVVVPSQQTGCYAKGRRARIRVGSVSALGVYFHVLVWSPIFWV
jgi:hypothetical protein